MLACCQGSLPCCWSCLLWCGPRCGGGLRSAFLAVSFAPLLRCTRCAGVLHPPPLGSVLREMHAEYSHASSMWVLRVPRGAESTHTGEMRRACRGVCRVLTCVVEQCIDVGTAVLLATRVRYTERAEDYAIRFVRVILLVVAQVSTDGLGDSGAKSEAPPLKPTEPTRARAPLAAGSTRAAQRGGSGRPVPAPRRSAPLTSAHDRAKRPVASGARVAGPQPPRASCGQSEYTRTHTTPV